MIADPRPPVRVYSSRVRANGGRPAIAIALALAVIFERAAYYVMRIAVGTQLRTLLDGDANRADIVLITSLGGLAGMLGGALLAAFAGPWAVVTAGLGIEAVAILAMPLLPPELVLLAFTAVHIGRGVALPAMLAAAADAFGGAREPARNGVFVALFLCVGVGAFLGPLVSYPSYFPGERGWSFEPGILLASLAAAIVVVTAIRTRVDRRATVPARGASLGPAAILLVLVAVPWSTSFTQAQLSPPLQLAGLDLPAGWSTLGSIGTLLLGLPALLFFLVLHAFGKRRFPTTRTVAVGLVLFGLGQLAFVPADTGSLALPILGTLCAGMSGLLVPLALSRIAGDLPHRLRTVAIALFLTLTQLPGMIVRGDTGVHAIAWAGFITALVIGAGLIATGGRLERLMREEDRAPDAPRAF